MAIAKRLLALVLWTSSAAYAQTQITPCFSVNADTLPAGQQSKVLLAVRTSTSGSLLPAGASAADQVTFVFDAAASAVQVINVDAAVTLHVGSGSTLAATDFQVITTVNSVSIKYVASTSKTLAAGETIAVHATLVPQIPGAFARPMVDDKIGLARASCNGSVRIAVAYVEQQSTCHRCPLNEA